jgi:hypothetical protein
MRPLFLSGDRIVMRFLPLALLLAACSSPNDPGEGGVTRAEADALNKAAEQLEQSAPPPSITNMAAPAAPEPPKLDE